FAPTTYPKSVGDCRDSPARTYVDQKSLYIPSARREHTRSSPTVPVTSHWPEYPACKVLKSAGTPTDRPDAVPRAKPAFRLQIPPVLDQSSTDSILYSALPAIRSEGQ